MSYFDTNNATETQIVSQFIVEKAEQGHFLRYSDYAIISKWTKACAEIDDLLVILDELLTEKKLAKKGQVTLKSLDKKVLTALNARY